MNGMIIVVCVVPSNLYVDLSQITNYRISDEAMSKIAQFKNMRQLSLFYCNISNRGMLVLSLTLTTYIILSNCYIKSIG